MSGPVAIERDALGRELHRLVADLFPICRSITGDGVRETLARIGSRLGKSVPLELHEVPTGTQVFDWTVPKEWNIRGASIRDQDGKTVLDFAACNLHVVGYSAPVHTRLPLSELKARIHTLPERPDWIPYRTSYYGETWGFCMSQRQRDALPDGEYDVRIDATLEDGHLSYGELCLPGETPDEILVSTHVCHPSLANDNLSGIAVATRLAAHLAQLPRRHSLRFLFLPATIGPITWLARNEARARKIRHGLVLACVGDPGSPTYKRTRRGDAPVDRAARHVLAHAGGPHTLEDFTPYGYDERQYGSPGFDLAVGCFMRTPHGRFAEYHTSADDLDFVRPEALADSFEKVLAIVRVLDRNRRYRNLNPKCEPQLGRRGLYDSLGGRPLSDDERMALLWVLNQSDGEHDLLAIADRSGLPFERIHWAVDALVAVDLLEPAKE
jgi:aminopeptidase-like protein